MKLKDLILPVMQDDEYGKDIVCSYIKYYAEYNTITEFLNSCKVDVEENKITLDSKHKRFSISN